MDRLEKMMLILMFSMSASAHADVQLIKEKQCMQCHDITAERIGPSFQRIAKRWKGNPVAEKLLIATIQQGTKDGGGQHWSSKANMPDSLERPLVSNDEAKRMVTWIMGLTW